ncbi:MAG: peptidogalycan biosysnthesis protein [Ignavibacteriaceae bacterium]
MNEVKVYNTIFEVEKNLWDSLTENNVFMCYEWLKTVENTLIPPVKPHYIMILDQNKLLAASVCYYQSKNKNGASLDNILLGKLKKIRWIKKLSFLPAVICNSKKGYGTHCIFSHEIEQNQIIELQNQLIEIIEKIASANKASICFPNVTNHESLLLNALKKKGYCKTKGTPYTYMDIIWSSFQDYKKCISKKYPQMRKSIQREINKNKKSGVVIKQLSNINGHQIRLYELLKMNHKKYNSGIFPFNTDYIEQVKENFGDDSIIYISVKEENITGVNIELRKGTEAVISNVGIDHKHAQNDLTYFNIVFYEPIRNAMLCGLKRLYCGNGLYKTKVRRGYKVNETYLFYKSNYKIYSFIIRLWFLFHHWLMTKRLSYLSTL